MSLTAIRRALIVAVVTVVLLVGGLVSYTIARMVLERNEPPYGSDGPHSGWWASWAGDFDGDGVPDVLLATRFEKSDGDWGVCRVVSGRDGSTLTTHASGSFVDHCESLGDLDGDGRSEIAWDAGDTQVVRSLDRVSTLPFASGWFGPACVLDDLDGDGWRDLVVCRRGERGSWIDRYSAISARSGAVIWTVEQSRDERYELAGLGCVVGDVDRDAIADVVVARGKRSVDLISGRTGTRIRLLDGACESVGGSVVALGDVDGDGSPEVLVDEGGLRACKVVACEDGEVVGRLRSPAYVRRVFSPGDVDGDGRADVAWSGSDGAECVRARDGARILLVPDARFGRGRADLDRDGFDDLLVMRNVWLPERAEAPADLWRQGRIEIVSGRTHAVLRTFDADALGLPR